MTHETIAAEKIALAWHMIYAVYAILCVVTSAMVAVMLEPFAVAPVVFFLYLLCVINAIGMAIQALFHLWGAREHRRQIEVLKP